MIATRNALLTRYDAVRRATERLCEPLAVEDMVAQSMPDASPVKWHLAHVTWFFETFVVARARPDLGPVHPRYGYLFNSYYDAVGPRHERAARGLLTRPTVAETFEYRRAVDERVHGVLEAPLSEEVLFAHEVGLQHEQQHQELLLMDVKHLLGQSPLRPAYRPAAPGVRAEAPLGWYGFDEGLAWIGAGDEGFAFDNERPRHRAFVPAFELADRLVTAGEWLAFMDAGGYERPELWMSDGWATARARGWRAPLYWERVDGAWHAYTLGGLRPVVASEPVCHVSWYEADAYARFVGARLPREEEWERAAPPAVAGNFVESGLLHPAGGGDLHGDAWQWTASAHAGYPGYRPFPGALREYNAKFACNQLVLRGGSCVTPREHARATYRNFFPPDARWPFTGVRLARDA